MTISILRRRRSSSTLISTSVGKPKSKQSKERTSGSSASNPICLLSDSESDFSNLDIEDVEDNTSAISNGNVTIAIKQEHPDLDLSVSNDAISNLQVEKDTLPTNIEFTSNSGDLLPQPAAINQESDKPERESTSLPSMLNPPSVAGGTETSAITHDAQVHAYTQRLLVSTELQTALVQALQEIVKKVMFPGNAVVTQVQALQNHDSPPVQAQDITAASGRTAIASTQSPRKVVHWASNSRQSDEIIRSSVGPEEDSDLDTSDRDNLEEMQVTEDFFADSEFY